jgi:plastocyanin
MRRSIVVLIVSLSLSAANCSGGGFGSDLNGPSPPPNPPPAMATDVVPIDIASTSGAQSFAPNPATVPAGHTVQWRNIDVVAHRIVLDNGSLDTGNIAPGGSSQPIFTATLGPYHCTIHPSMVGTLR